jgi:hypothetical protein
MTNQSTEPSAIAVDDDALVKRVAQAMAEEAGLLWEALPEKWDMVCGHGMPEAHRKYWYDLARIAIRAIAAGRGEQ